MTGTFSRCIIATVSIWATSVGYASAQSASNLLLVVNSSSPSSEAVAKHYISKRGVSQDNAAQFLACRNVACVGGSWLTPKDALAAGDWERITQLARAASS